MKSEKEKMIAGEIYNPADPHLIEDRKRARFLSLQLNSTDPNKPEEMQKITSLLLNNPVNTYITPPFFCDYGYNIELEENVYFNFNCIVLDVTKVKIGANTLFAPGVHIYTATHPIDSKERVSGIEYGKPVTIGKNVWVGGGSIICPGVTIGDNVVIGAGSVVTKDLPACVLAAGNPCKIIREIS